MSFMEKVDKARAGRSLKSLAVKSGIPPQRFTDWRGGIENRKPTLAQALAVAKALGVPLDWLADDAMVDPPYVLSEDERWILTTARIVGIDEAKRRLTATQPEVSAEATIRGAVQVNKEPYRKGG